VQIASLLRSAIALSPAELSKHFGMAPRALCCTSASAQAAAYFSKSLFDEEIWGVTESINNSAVSS
jgi:hypothetical protein